MPGCNQSLTGIAKDCAPNMGGIKRLLLVLFAAVTATVDQVTGKITAITLAEGADKFKEFALPKGVASLASTLNTNAENGTNFVTNVLTLAFNRMDTAKRMAVSAIAVAECAAIVEDNNGKFWFVGLDEPLTATGGDSGSGAAKTDRNGYGITLQSEELSYPYEILTGDGGVDISALID